MSDNRPIGVFDSGLGGLCAVNYLRKLLPYENIVYLGDTGRVPYGTKSRETIIEYARDDVRFLLSKNVKTIVAACGTVSSVALDVIKQETFVSMTGIVEGAVSEAIRSTENGVIAVIGTSATISSGVFEKKLYESGAKRVVSQACPLLVPLVECGFAGKDNDVAKRVCDSYLGTVRASGADTLILGCTHFPLLSDVISKVLPGVLLIDPAKQTARLVEKTVDPTDRKTPGKTEYFVTDDALGFSEAANIFLGDGVKIRAEKVNL